jgi:hypothetical protein
MMIRRAYVTVTLLMLSHLIFPSVVMTTAAPDFDTPIKVDCSVSESDLWVHVAPGFGGSWRGDALAGLIEGFKPSCLTLLAPAVDRVVWPAAEGCGRTRAAGLLRSPSERKACDMRNFLQLFLVCIVMANMQFIFGM